MDKTVICIVVTGEEKKYWHAFTVSPYVGAIVGESKQEAVDSLEAALKILGYKPIWEEDHE